MKNGDIYAVAVILVLATAIVSILLWWAVTIGNKLDRLDRVHHIFEDGSVCHVDPDEGGCDRLTQLDLDRRKR